LSAWSGDWDAKVRINQENVESIAGSQQVAPNGNSMRALVGRTYSLHRFILALSLTMAGCATYRPAPLAPEAGLVRPDLAEAVALAPVAHPRLPAAVLRLDQPLGELDVARLALLLNPELRAQRRQAGVADAQLFAAGLLPDPQWSLAVDVPGTAGLVDALTAGLGLDLGNLLARPAARQASRHALEKVRLDIAWSEWLAINQARTLCRRIHFLQVQADIAGQSTTVARRLFQLSAENKRRGDARLDETTIYQVAFIDAQDRHLAILRSLAQARLELNALLGLKPADELRLAPPPPAGRFHLDSNQLMHDAIGQRLDLRALREGYLAQESELRRAVRASIPLPQLSWNRARDTGGVWTRGVGVGLAVPIWNRGRGSIRIASANREQLAAEYEARVYQASMDIAGATSDLEAIEAQRAALALELPSLASSADVLDKAARAGNVALLTAQTTRAALLDKQLVLSGLEQALAEGEVALDTAMGRLPGMATTQATESEQ
jgi:outer membrane protein TolC